MPPLGQPLLSVQWPEIKHTGCLGHRLQLGCGVIAAAGQHATCRQLQDEGQTLLL